MIQITREIFEDKNNEKRKQIESSLKQNQFCSMDWDVEFQALLAEWGCVSVASGDFLVPELQKKYSSIFPMTNVQESKKLKKLAKGQSLKFNRDPTHCLSMLDKHFDNNWLNERYKNLMKDNLNQKRVDGKFNFRFLTVELQKDDQMIAGEAGYSIGSTQTSLTGFWDKEYCIKNKIKSPGKVQLMMLGMCLRKHGVNQWNLGHPACQGLEQKNEIGGKDKDRKEFLEGQRKYTSDDVKIDYHNIEETIDTLV